MLALAETGGFRVEFPGKACYIKPVLKISHLF
jgi:hypothetical protein